MSKIWIESWLLEGQKPSNQEGSFSSCCQFCCLEGAFFVASYFVHDQCLYHFPTPHIQCLHLSCSFLRRLPDQHSVIESFSFSSEMLLFVVCGVQSSMYLTTLLLVQPSSTKNCKERETNIAEPFRMCCSGLFTITKYCWKSHRTSIVLPFFFLFNELLLNSAGNQRGCLEVLDWHQKLTL